MLEFFEYHLSTYFKIHLGHFCVELLVVIVFRFSLLFHRTKIVVTAIKRAGQITEIQHVKIATMLSKV